MGFRFQKRIKILPGLRINLSKSGVSTSLGVPGAQITKGHGKTRTTLGLPGTGLSHSQVTSTSSAEVAEQPRKHWAVETALAVAKAIALVAVAYFAVIAALLATNKQR